jgi:hypothetical protein
MCKARSSTRNRWAHGFALGGAPGCGFCPTAPSTYPLQRCEGTPPAPPGRTLDPAPSQDAAGALADVAGALATAGGAAVALPEGHPAAADVGAWKWVWGQDAADQEWKYIYRWEASAPPPEGSEQQRQAGAPAGGGEGSSQQIHGAWKWVWGQDAADQEWKYIYRWEALAPPPGGSEQQRQAGAADQAGGGAAGAGLDGSDGLLKPGQGQGQQAPSGAAGGDAAAAGNAATIANATAIVGATAAGNATAEGNGTAAATAQAPAPPPRNYLPRGVTPASLMKA